MEAPRDIISNMADTRTCPRCMHAVDPQAHYCNWCGMNLSAAPGQTVPPLPPPPVLPYATPWPRGAKPPRNVGAPRLVWVLILACVLVARMLSVNHTVYNPLAPQTPQRVAPLPQTTPPGNPAPVYTQPKPAPTPPPEVPDPEGPGDGASR